MSELSFKLKGLTPLVMNNGEKADPDSEYAIKMAELKASGAKKSPEGRMLINRCDWEGGLYFHDKMGPVVPDVNILKMVVNGGAPQKMGKEFCAYISVAEPFTKLEYKGPRDLDGMWAANMYDRRLVSSNGKPGGPKVIRFRPLFKDWSLSFNLFADDEVDPKSIVDAMRHAGKRVGLCERSMFRWGRFETIEAKVITK